MEFSECLKDHMQHIGCTAAELSVASDVPASSLSRYLSGARTPRPEDNVLAKLAKGLSVCAKARSGWQLDEQAVHDSLAQASGGTVDREAFADNLRNVLDTFNVARNRLARAMGFDPSYVSRILSNERRPSDLPHFIDGVAAYITRNHFDAPGIALAAELTSEPLANLDTPEKLADAIRRFLSRGYSSKTQQGKTDAAAIGSFLAKLDEFDLEDFLRGIRFDELKVPTMPFQLPTTKTYTGIEEMKQAELDFLKAAVLSKSTDDVILYSDMPLDEMAADQEFPKKVMMGIALLIRKGIHLHNIHDVHRPRHELFMGLEGWIPAYMTGQMSPYYLPHATNRAFLHFIRSAGTVAVSGEAIVGNQGAGRYTLVKGSSDVAYYRRRAEQLLSCAKPLMRVFDESRNTQLQSAIDHLAERVETEPISVGAGTFKNLTITVLPGSYALIEKATHPKVSLLVEYPALVDALEQFEPLLFGNR